MKAMEVYALSLLLFVPLAMAQTTASTTTTTTTTATPTPATSTVTTDKLTTEFSAWVGSPDNATALVTGLRTGTPITLTEPVADGTSTTTTTTTTTTFSPPTKPMGYGNIRIALSLARAQLSSQGITNPTTAELQGALVGTPDGMTQGVLQMRASGMGWGQIANSMGFKLGAVMSGKQTFATATTGTSATTTATGTSATANAGQTRKGVVTANGGPAGGASAGKSGTTTATGSAGKVTTGMGHAYGNAGGGVVNAGGVKAAGAAGSNAGGHGKGGGKS